MKSRILPALVLLILTPLIAEYLLGSLSVAQIAALPVLMLMYGGGAVLIRETARATGRGWPAIVVLGLAYAFVEEGIATQSLFNPHYLGLRLLDYGFIPALGIGAWWTVYVLLLHVIWSVCVPIALVEALFAREGDARWMGVVGRTVFGVLLLVGVLAVTGYTRRTEKFWASPLQLTAIATIVIALVFLALRVARGSNRTDARLAPKPWLVTVFTLVAGSLFEVAQSLHTRPVPWPVTVAAVMIVVTAGALVLAQWSQRTGWSAKHRFAAGAGGTLVYCWYGYNVEVSLHGTAGLPAHTVLVVATLALLLAVALKFRKGARGEQSTGAPAI